MMKRAWAALCCFVLLAGLAVAQPYGPAPAPGNTGTASSITPGTTGIAGGTAPCLIENSTDTTMACPAVTAGNITALGVATGSAGAPVLFNGAGGTPSSLTLTNATGLPVSGVTGLGTGVGAALANAVNGSGGLLTFSLIGTSGATIPLLNTANTWGASQRFVYQTPTISTATFTPAVASGNNIRIGLTSACPCTLANFSGSLVAGQQGVIEIAQDGTGSRTIGTWGSTYVTPGGTSSITLSTAAGTVDYLPYAVDSTATVVVLGALIKGPTH